MIEEIVSGDKMMLTDRKMDEERVQIYEEES